MIKIGPYTLDSRLVLAPMAGVTDLPFRKLCRQYGAALAPSEMVTSNVQLWDREKCRLRRCHDDEPAPRVIQIAGADPAMMAQAARLNAEHGAQIIDINMGCPAKKVLKRSAGSALLQYPALVADILRAVVAAVEVPVTLKIRTGWDPQHRNGIQIARLAEDCGILSLVVHGRTRACGFRGSAEYDTIAAIKEAVAIPVFANGDIATEQQAARILAHTGADGLMIGRGAQGRPWIFAAINHYLETGKYLAPMSVKDIRQVLRSHLQSLYDWYGHDKGIWYARKHVAWYLEAMPMEDGTRREYRRRFNALTASSAQLACLQMIFDDMEKQQYKNGELAA